jgi:hypothetical protein
MLNDLDLFNAKTGFGISRREGVHYLIKEYGRKMTNDQDTRSRIASLRLEHRDLDDVIHRLLMDGAPDRLQIQRLKKRKLGLKDQIAKLESGSIPNIIA